MNSWPKQIDSNTKSVKDLCKKFQDLCIKTKDLTKDVDTNTTNIAENTAQNISLMEAISKNGILIAENTNQIAENTAKTMVNMDDITEINDRFAGDIISLDVEAGGNIVMNSPVVALSFFSRINSIVTLSGTITADSIVQGAGCSLIVTYPIPPASASGITGSGTVWAGVTAEQNAIAIISSTTTEFFIRFLAVTTGNMNIINYVIQYLI